MRQPHILYVTNGNMLRMTGFSEQCRAEVTQLATRGLRVTALAFENHRELRDRADARRELAALYRQAGARLLTVPVFAESRPAFWPLRAALDTTTLALFARGLKADILHTHDVIIGEQATWVARALGLALVTDLHGVPVEERIYAGAMQEGDPTHRLLVRAETRAVRGADRVFVVSEPFRDHIVARYGRAPADVVVTRSSVDTARFRFDPAARVARRRELGVSGPLLLFVGSIHHYQVFDEVVAFYAAMKARNPAARLLILTSDVNTTLAALGRLGFLEDALVRRVPHALVPEYMSAADLGVLLREDSLVNRVASPVKAAEYLACGLPLAVSVGVGDISALVADERLGAVVERLDRAAYDAALDRLDRLAREDRESLRARCRDAAQRLFSWDVCMDTFITTYRQLRPDLF